MNPSTDQRDPSGTIFKRFRPEFKGVNVQFRPVGRGRRKVPREQLPFSLAEPCPICGKSALHSSEAQAIISHLAHRLVELERVPQGLGDKAAISEALLEALAGGTGGEPRESGP